MDEESNFNLQGFIGKSLGLALVFALIGIAVNMILFPVFPVALASFSVIGAFFGVGFGLGLYSGSMLEFLNSSNNAPSFVSSVVGELLGGVVMGASFGAMVGTVLFPGLGTAFGAIIGGAFGVLSTTMAMGGLAVYKLVSKKSSEANTEDFLDETHEDVNRYSSQNDLEALYLKTNRQSHTDTNTSEAPPAYSQASSSFWYSTQQPALATPADCLKTVYQPRR